MSRSKLYSLLAVLVGSAGLATRLFLPTITEFGDFAGFMLTLLYGLCAWLVIGGLVCYRWPKTPQQIRQFMYSKWGIRLALCFALVLNLAVGFLKLNDRFGWF